jgi:hypothetical protein
MDGHRRVQPRKRDLARGALGTQGAELHAAMPQRCARRGGHEREAEARFHQPEYGVELRALDGDARGVAGALTERQRLPAQAVGVAEQNKSLVAQVGQAQVAARGEPVAAWQGE